MLISKELGPDLPDSVQLCIQSGWSFIPLHGNRKLQAAKTPAISTWKIYQDRRPSHQEYRRWLESGHCGAFGVVLGHVSGLVVLDIDDPRRAEDFVRVFPDLLETLTIRSGNRELPHYYFRIPATARVPSRACDGVELRSNGQYVVAPGSVINGKHWQITHNVAPRLLSSSDLRRILTFVQNTTPQPPVKREPATSTAGRFLPAGRSGSPASLIRRYERVTARLGRNNALFYTACWARDHHWSLQQVQDLLLPVHAVYQTRQSHPPETIGQRYHEGQRTIHSVYRRPARTDRVRHHTDQLPNAVREKLLQLGLDQLARVLDGLLIVGFKAGQVFTVSQAYQLLKQLGIGRNAIFSAVKMVVATGKAIFTVLKSSFPLNPLSPDANAAAPRADRTKQCLFGRVANPVKSKGRPENHFLVPAINHLCELLGVENTGGDKLHPDDLRSPSAYRAALHIALFRRAPGRYPRRWLGQRLGISADTCRRYERRAGVRVSAVFRTAPLYWSNIEHILPDEPLAGSYLQDNRGERYPALRSLARRLLSQGYKLFFQRQDANDYRFTAASAQVDLPSPRPQSCPPAQPHESHVPAPVYLPIWPAQPTGIAPDSVISAPTPESLRLKGDQPSAYAPGAINLADDLYRLLRQLNPQRALTRKNIDRLLGRFDAGLVRRGMGVLRARRDIRNPAGFLITWLRSERLRAALASA